MIAFFTAGDEPQDTVCWPENWQAVLVFSVLGPQWSTSGALLAVLDVYGVKKKDRARMFNQLRDMEIGLTER
jgi:hypothetical protein